MTFSHFPQNQGKCPNIPAPGRSEIPHGGDDAVVGGETFSHFPQNQGKCLKKRRNNNNYKRLKK